VKSTTRAFAVAIRSASSADELVQILGKHQRKALAGYARPLLKGWLAELAPSVARWAVRTGKPR
jgi:hypothetical protein